VRQEEEEAEEAEGEAVDHIPIDVHGIDYDNHRRSIVYWYTFGNGNK
jgi:hypothetical protein